MKASLPINRKCIVAISFLNYQTTVGGMSKYIMAHEKMYTNSGFSYIGIYSVKKIVKNKYPLFYFYGLIVDGIDKGLLTIDELLQYFDTIYKTGYSICDVHIHNISYMNLDHIIRMANTLYDVSYKVILHDFHTICTNFNLLRNGITYCGGERLSEKKCSGCKYYEYSYKFIMGVRQFLGVIKSRLTIVAPSEVAKNILLESYPEYSDNIVVMTEQIWEGKYLDNREILEPDKQITIGYLGNKSPHKGWNEWAEFVRRANQSHLQYKCMVFNSKQEFNDSKMIHYPVRFKKDNLNAMITALRENKVACVLLWSIWPETYSYTLFEACAANAFIITNQNSGNIAFVVSQRGNGIVLDTEEELFYYAEHPEKLIEKINFVRTNGVPGPENLVDNDAFLKLTDCSKQYHIKYKKSNIFYRINQKFILKTVQIIISKMKIKIY